MRSIGKLSDTAIMALIDWLDASCRNAKDTDEEWAKGFQEVQRKQDILSRYFTSQEITEFIINKSELADLINKYRTN